MTELARGPLVLPPITSGARPHNGRPEFRDERGMGGQVLLIDKCMAFKVCVCAYGRRVGKTTGAVFLVMEEGARYEGIYLAGYVAQSHPQAEEMYESCLEEWTAAGLVLRKKNKGQDRWIQLRPFGRNQGFRMWFWSGEQGAHDNVRGKGLNRLIIDEASFIPEEAWTDTFGPMLVDRQGHALIEGTPKPEGIGFAWFEELFNDCVNISEHGDKDQWGLNAPIESNPINSVEYCEFWRRKARKRGAHVEASEYDGLFTADLGGVFVNLEMVFDRPVSYRVGDWWVGEEPRRNGVYGLGQDWGRHDDNSVTSIFDLESRNEVCAGRFIDMEYDSQVDQIAQWWERYHRPMIVADDRETGSYVNKMMRDRGMQVLGVKWSRGGEFDKQKWVTRGRVFCQDISWHLLNIPEQKEEFRLYSRTKLPASDGYRYSAPSGKKDDWVASKLFAAELLDRPVPKRADHKPAAKPYTREWFLQMDALNKRMGGRAEVMR